MKSKRAREYLSNICKTSAIMYDGEPAECDLKLKNAKEAVELAEEDMIDKAVNAFCFSKCGYGPCVMKENGRDECKELWVFKRKLME